MLGTDIATAAVAQTRQTRPKLLNMNPSRILLITSSLPCSGVLSLILLFLASMGSCRKDHKKYAIREAMIAKEWEGHECKGDCPGKQEKGPADPLSSFETRLRGEA